jgi:hypothetical protein
MIRQQPHSLLLSNFRSSILAYDTALIDQLDRNLIESAFQRERVYVDVGEGEVIHKVLVGFDSTHHLRIQIGKEVAHIGPHALGSLDKLLNDPACSMPDEEIATSSLLSAKFVNGHWYMTWIQLINAIG